MPTVTDGDRLVIVGCGAMACLFGARLAERMPVVLLGSWPQGLAAIERDGIRVEVAEETSVRRVDVTSDPVELAGAKQALVLVKSWQTARAADQLAELLAPEGVALTLQNGLGNAETLARALGDERTAVGVTTYGANLVGPGRVRPGGEGQVLLEDHPRVDGVRAMLASAGLRVDVVDDVTGLAWGKLAVNAGINPLTALLEIRNGELLERPAAARVLEEAAREVAAVAAAQGIELPQGDPAEVARQVARRTATNRSSMLQDLARGAPTEIEAICGAVVERGRQFGVATPVNWTLWQLVAAEVEGDPG